VRKRTRLSESGASKPTAHTGTVCLDSDDEEETADPTKGRAKAIDASIQPKAALALAESSSRRIPGGTLRPKRTSPTAKAATGDRADSAETKTGENVEAVTATGTDTPVEPGGALLAPGPDEQLELQAQAMADKAMQNVPAAARDRAAKASKVKESILKRLKEQATVVPATPAGDTPPPPPPPELKEEKTPDEVVGKVLRAPMQVMTPLIAKELSEQHRLAERQKRKALWSGAGTEQGGSDCREASPETNTEGGKLTANGWERSQFDSAEDKNKFLRLMGGQKFAAVVEAAAGGHAVCDDDLPTDCPTLEWVPGGGLVEASAPHLADEDLPSNCPTVELSGGQWVEAEVGFCPANKVDADENKAREVCLERQFLDGLKRRTQMKGRGIGA